MEHILYIHAKYFSTDTNKIIAPKHVVLHKVGRIQNFLFGSHFYCIRIRNGGGGGGRLYLCACQHYK